MFRGIRCLLFFSFFCLIPMSVYAKDFVVNANTSVTYEVPRSVDQLQAFNSPEFISRNLPGIESIEQLKGEDFLWDLKIPVPMARDMTGTFISKREVLNSNHMIFTSPKESEDFMRCEIKVEPKPNNESQINISMNLKFTRSNGLKFHWMAPLLGEEFLSERVKEMLDKMLNEFILNSKEELEAVNA